MTNKTGWTRLQGVALSQIILISIQLALGLFFIAWSNGPAFSGSGSNTFGQVAILLFVAFCIPAVPVLLSALVFVKPREQVSDQGWVVARRTQLTVFVFCLATLIPAIALVANGFPFFAVDCVLGIIFWALVNKDTTLKGATNNG